MRIGFDDVDAHLEKGAMQVANDVGTRNSDEISLASFERGAAEVVRTQPTQLQVGAAGAVEDHDALSQTIEVAGHGSSSVPVRSWRTSPLWTPATHAVIRQAIR